MEILLALVCLAAIALFLVALGLFALLQKTKGEAEHAEERAATAEKRAMTAAMLDAAAYIGKKEKELRADAIRRSGNVIKGKRAEQLVPFDPAWPFDPRDCRFVGAPIDYVVFEGLSGGDLERVVFVEVKTGRSRLNKRERQVKEAIENSEFTFMQFRVKE